jgi:hypothetical protein
MALPYLLIGGAILFVPGFELIPVRLYHGVEAFRWLSVSMFPAIPHVLAPGAPHVLNALTMRTPVGAIASGLVTASVPIASVAIARVSTRLNLLGRPIVEVLPA